MTRSRRAARRPVRRPPKRAAKSTSRRRRNLATAHAGSIEVHEIESLRDALERAASPGPPRWNADPEDVRRSVVKLVLTLVEFVRQLLERQAIRRVEAGTLTSRETEAVGLALMRLEETIRDLCRQFDLAPEDLNLQLGPLGTLNRDR